MFIAGLSTLLILGLTTPTAYSASNAPGTKCTKVGATAKSGSVSVKCVKSGSKMVWQKVVTATPTKAASAVCVAGGQCAMGSKGPGGGIVFYDAGSTQSWGRYLEAAPSGWSGSATDPSEVWCNDDTVALMAKATDPTLKAALGPEIGKGKADTNLMLTGCTSGAGVVARAYHGANLSDWYLPSLGEMQKMYSVLRDYNAKLGGYNFGKFSNADYWSSSEDDSSHGKYVSADGNPGTQPKSWHASVRPIRAF